jgi:hypothetical protein
MTRVPRLHIAAGMHVTLGMALATLFCLNFGPISKANAQTYGSSYTRACPQGRR